MGLFTKISPADQLAQVREKLAQAEADVATTERALRDGALEFALSDNPAAPEPQREALRRARERVEMLQHAVVAAEEGVRQEQARAAAAIQATRNRSIRQRIALMTKAAAKYQAATKECVQAYREMVEIAGEINRLVPIGREFHGFTAELSPTRLTSYCLAEVSRVGAEHPHRQDRGQPTAPAASYYGHDLDYGIATVHQLPPLADRIQGRLLTQYRRLIGSAPPPPVTAPATRAPAGNPPPPSETPAVSAATPTAAGKPVQTTPATPDFSRVHPDDPAARAGVEFELAILRGVPVEMTEVDQAEVTEVDPAALVAEAAPVVDLVEPFTAAVADQIEVRTAEVVDPEPIERPVNVGMVFARMGR